MADTGRREYSRRSARKDTDGPGSGGERPADRRGSPARGRAWITAFLLGLVFATVPGAANGQASGNRSSQAVGEFVASSRGEVYYWVGCDAWRSLAPRNLRWFATAAEAEAAGYRPSAARDCVAPARRAEPGPDATHRCTVARIVDGDTLDCRESAERIRLLLIDAPELGQGPTGEAARSALATLLPPGSEARVELDVQERDRYGRILAYLYTGSGEFVNHALVARGYALPLVYPPNVKYVEEIRAAAAAARERRLGLWSVDAFACEPVDYRAGRCQ